MSSETASPAIRRRNPRVRIAALALAAAAAGALPFFLSAGRRAPTTASAPAPRAVEQAPQPPAVEVETVASGSLSQPLRVTGTLKTDEVVEVSTKAQGLVRQVFVREGDQVRKGDLLAVIDDGELRAQRDRARAAVAAAEARLTQSRTSREIKDVAADSEYQRALQAVEGAKNRLNMATEQAKISDTEAETRVGSAKAGLQSAQQRLKMLQEGARRQERASAELAVTRAQAQVNKLKSNLDRREQLLRDGAIAREVVENARRDYEVAVAELDTARQQRDLVLEGPRGEEVRMAEEAVRQAEAALRDAEAYRARRKISSEEVEAAASQVRQAQSTADAAKAALAGKRVNQDEIRTATAALNQARADVRYYDELISQSQMRSPVNGVVSVRQAHVGESVSQMNSKLMTLVSGDTLYFEATAPETSLPYLQPGLPAQVSLDALPGKTFSGTVRQIIPVTQGGNRSVRVRVSLPRPGQAAAVVGGFARAEIEGRSRGAVLSVPRTAVVSDEGETAVFLVVDGRAQRRPVRLGSVSGQRAEVLSGLRGGERVITRGAETLTDGQQVTE